MRRLVAITVVLHAVVTGVFLAVGAGVALVPLLALPIAEVALLAAHPLEERLSHRYEVSAVAKIKQVSPRVVAITGSYGKTSTKNYAAHLIAGRWSVLASPASFNNVLGLARSVNDRLVPGTDVFVAEMGTYGPGEIARLCRLFPPEVSAITTIGEAHLERMQDRATIVRAKSEILEPARTVVLNVDVPELEEAADRYPATKRVIRACDLRGRRRRRRRPARRRTAGCSSCPARSIGSRCPPRSGTRSTRPSRSAWRSRSTYRRRRSWTGSPRCPRPRTAQRRRTLDTGSRSSTTPTTPTPRARRRPW